MAGEDNAIRWYRFLVDGGMSKKTVLVVDDEAALADLFTRYLEDEFRVITAYDGLDAMDLIDESVDIVTLDLRMAGVTGGQFFTWMREEGYDCPVIVVSAINPIEADLPLEPEEYLVKPISREQILAAVREYA